MVTITSVKRNLSKIGIGNPLNQLIYTAEEIEEMKKRGEMFDMSNPEVKQKMRELAKARMGGGRPKTRGEGYASGYTCGYLAGSKKSQTTLLSKMDMRLKRAVELWCQWNRKELDGSDFANKFGNLFNDECLAEWNK